MGAERLLQFDDGGCCTVRSHRRCDSIGANTTAGSGRRRPSMDGRLAVIRWIQVDDLKVQKCEIPWKRVKASTRKKKRSFSVGCVKAGRALASRTVGDLNTQRGGFRPEIGRERGRRELWHFSWGGRRCWSVVWCLPRIKTAASKSKEGSASQASIETTDNVTPSETTTIAATTTTTIPTTTNVPTPQTNKLPPTTPKKRKSNTTGEDPKAGGNLPTASKKKQKKDILKSIVPTSLATSLTRVHRIS
ncbi:unnamed protein product [Vicia faba]|uniref:Uncharacterized protein n=1 Tax=Vicia faba TaxID=3906 RepID=A0AAV1A205_VICFA|nr:unnamed protein product [Vicia faba]